MRPSLRRKLLDLSLVRFLLVGVANTAVGLGIIYAGKWFFGLGDTVANMVGYGCGLVLSFILNKKWSFRYHGSALFALLRFFLVIVVAYLLNLGLTLTAINDFGVNSYLAHALGVIPYTITTYLGSRYFVFSEARYPTKKSHGGLPVNSNDSMMDMNGEK